MFAHLLSSMFAIGCMLLVFAFVGRVVLSLLPPGPLGSHSPRDLVTTWAASHLLGSGVLAVQEAVYPEGWLGLQWLLAPWVVIGVLRLATLPGRILPGPDEALASDAREPGPAGRALALAFAGLALFPVARVLWQGEDTDGVLGAISGLALLLLVNHGLMRLPGRPLVLRTLALAAATWVGFQFDLSAGILIVFVGAGVAALPAALRQADRRATAFAVLAFGIVAALFALVDDGQWQVGLAGIAGLYIARFVVRTSGKGERYAIALPVGLMMAVVVATVPEGAGVSLVSLTGGFALPLIVLLGSALSPPAPGEVTATTGEG